MCNPTDNLVQYPLPYKVVNGCLCQETTKRNKPTTEKLCNFTAYIVNEVLFDGRWNVAYNADRRRTR